MSLFIFGYVALVMSKISDELREKREEAKRAVLNRVCVRTNVIPDLTIENCSINNCDRNISFNWPSSHRSEVGLIEECVEGKKKK